MREKRYQIYLMILMILMKEIQIQEVLNIKLKLLVEAKLCLSQKRKRLNILEIMIMNHKYIAKNEINIHNFINFYKRTNIEC